MSTITIYYSDTGHTRKEAKLIAGEIVEIKMVKNLPKNSFLKMIIGGRYVSRKKDINLEKYEIDFSKYDEINILAPIWAGKIAKPISQVINTHFDEIKNKKINLTVTCGGSDGNVKKTYSKMFEKFTYNAVKHKK